MVDYSARTLKITRLLAFAHISVGVLLFLFGIVDRVHGYFWSGNGCFGIWCGIWMCITGGLGIPASNRDSDRNSSSNCMTGAFMGFAITSAVFGGVIMISYSISIASYHYWLRDQNVYYYTDYGTEMAMSVIILILGIAEFAFGIWAAIVCCVINGCNCCTTPSDQQSSVMHATAGHSMVPGGHGYVMGQGTGGCPVAYPIQQAGGVVTVQGAQPQMVHMPPMGAVHVAGQPPIHQVSTSGAQMVPVSGAAGVNMPPSGAEGGQPRPVHGAAVSERGQSQFDRVTPGGPVTEGQGTQQVQVSPPSNPDGQLPVKT